MCRRNRRGVAYITPRPLHGHRPRRYSVKEVLIGIEGSAVGWVEWLVVYERK